MQKDDIYYRLRNSVVKDLPREYVEINTSTFKDKAEAFQAITQIHQIIIGHKARGTKYYCQFGDALAKYKYFFYTKCQECCADMNLAIYKAIACSRCIKTSDTKEFFSTVKNITGYSKSHINFMINLGRLGVKYSKFMLTSLPLGDLKTHFKYILKCIEEDGVFWSA